MDPEVVSEMSPAPLSCDPEGPGDMLTRFCVTIDPERTLNLSPSAPPVIVHEYFYWHRIPNETLLSTPPEILEGP